MSSLPIRDQKSDHLIIPENAGLIVIDFQPVQVNCFHGQAMVETGISLQES